MKFRIPALAFGVLVAFSFASMERGRAQDDPMTEIAALKKLVEEQGKQLEALAAQVAELLAKQEAKAATPATPASVPASPAVAPLVATPLPMQPEPNVYVIERGDSLEKIAKSYGTTTAELQKLNNISDPNRVQIGQKILLPAGLVSKEE